MASLNGEMRWITLWQSDKKFSDKFIVEIKHILGEYLLVEYKDEDIYHNSDLVVLRLDNVRVACRIRRYKYFAKYGHQFTIRKSRPSGRKSELTKIIEGWGDYLFYGFSDEANTALHYWTLCDFKVFRLWFSRELLKTAKLPGGRKLNKDNSSDFLVFNFTDLPDAFILGEKL